MATTHRARIKQLEHIDAELAALRDQRARMDARIAILESTRRADLLELASEILAGVDLLQMPVSAICAYLTALDGAVPRSDGADLATTKENAGDEKIATFIKISRNVGKRKRALLEQAGLHWHGRDGGWTGFVGSAALTQLRDVFGDKVEKPRLVAPEAPSSSAQESAAVPSCADEEPNKADSQLNVGIAECTGGDETTFAPLHRIMHFRGFPRRPQASEEPAGPP
ncbi:MULTISPECIES: hypothetical protein [Bradyrhizobium]|uniref:Uncharacterized protein n=1 Tax=Bradyrhizobium canariense TaxID=255045 RepID=A0A1X3GZ51_9BRAD|nr:MULTISPECIES: hypothetical protein [Bradyrhizobium]OSI64707.1 hypothetical protein BSZ22_32510 [Bradyrhizobium canariense]OSI79234.1 hypothetical protein BSZ23_15915 [Bradyrhizobium canariense]OSI90664.1 hypothetical protein BSZ24_19280 [Bradyrhizobium canariense]OSI91676.1 hypothetical protein BSZ25_14810 [Bradyrhizobium canariense]OSJ03743.1 hypothetical protein BSZ18_31035 [Bradyrhizobium canariense]